jgi:hypothetical protein
MRLQFQVYLGFKNVQAPMVEATDDSAGIALAVRTTRPEYWMFALSMARPPRTSRG